VEGTGVLEARFLADLVDGGRAVHEAVDRHVAAHAVPPRSPCAKRCDAAVAADGVGHVVMGNVIPTEPRDAYLSRVAAIEAGIPQKRRRST
jgi:acetyl-CoA acetyltransferase